MGWFSIVILHSSRERGGRACGEGKGCLRGAECGEGVTAAESPQILMVDERSAQHRDTATHGGASLTLRACAKGKSLPLFMGRCVFSSGTWHLTPRERAPPLPPPLTGGSASREIAHRQEGTGRGCPLSANLSPLTLLLVSMIGLHLIVADVTQEAYDLSSKFLLNRIAQATANPTQYRAFSDAGELETYLGRRMLKARKSICDLTWKETISSGLCVGDRQISHKLMDRCISEAFGRTTYQEISVFSDPGRLKKLQRRLPEAKSGYSCRYFRQEATIPRL